VTNVDQRTRGLLVAARHLLLGAQPSNLGPAYPGSQELHERTWHETRREWLAMTTEFARLGEDTK
jgi:hypothetical protein